MESSTESESFEGLISLINERDNKDKLAEKISQIKSKPVEEQRKLAKEFVESESLATAISLRFQEQEGAGMGDDPLCSWFYDWYQLEEPGVVELRTFVLRFIPILVWCYLYRQHQTTTRVPLLGIETFFICVYNRELLRREGKEKKWVPPSFSTIRNVKDRSKVGTLTTSSSLTEKALKQFDDSQDRTQILSEALPLIDNGALTKSKRDLIVQIALQHFTENINSMPSTAIDAFCIVAAKLSVIAYPFDNLPKSVSSLSKSNGKEEDSDDEQNDNVPAAPLVLRASSQTTARIQLSRDIFQELINGITFALFKPATQRYGKLALDSLTHRASYDIMPEVLLSTNALHHVIETESNKNFM